MLTRWFWVATSVGLVFGLSAFGCTLTSPNTDAAGGAAPVCTCSPPPVTDPMAATKGPCDIYALDGGPCVAAHSTVRALYASYAGPLYQVRKPSGVLDIKPMTPGGFANSADQDAFCATDPCTISIIYDQSGKGNHLT